MKLSDNALSGLSTSDIPYFYAPEVQQTLVMPPNESAHCIRVLRLTVGDKVMVTDGCGGLFVMEILTPDPKGTVLTLKESLLIDDIYIPCFYLAIAPTKNMDRIEWMAEKLTEIGLTHLHLVCTDRTIRRKVNMDRLEKIIISAMKQSHRRFKPSISWHKSLKAFLSTPMPDNRYIAYCGDEFDKVDLKKGLTLGYDAIYMIGPEGDFTPDEVKTCQASGFTPVSLGDCRLRTETAGLYVGTLHQILNDK